MSAQFTTAWLQQLLLRKAARDGEHSEAVQNEADLHEQIIVECRRRRWQFLHGAMSERTHRTLGEPDFIILADAGRVLLVECKSRQGKLSPAQQAFRLAAEINGHCVHVVRSMADFLKLCP